MTRRHILTAIAVLPLVGCGAEPISPGTNPTPDPVDVTVVVHIAGFGSDPDGFDFWISGTKIGRLGAGDLEVDSIVAQVIPGEHDLFITELDPPCYTSSLTERLPFFLPGNRVEAEVFCGPTGSVQIAYTVEGDFASEIEILCEGGFETFRPGGSSEWHPSWSADGSQLAMVSDRDGNPEIYLADFEGGTDTRVTDNDAEDLDPALSPDGSRVAFISTRGGIGRDVWVIAITDGTLTRLTATVRPESDPAWAPDGASVVFSRNDEDLSGNPDGSVDTTYVDRIYRVPATGGDAEYMMTGSSPHWGHDNRVYFSQWLGAAFGEGRAIGSRDPDGTNVARHSGFSGEIRMQPDLSPDGEYVIFANADPGGFRIYATHIATGEVQRITTGVASHTAPAWRPGTFIGDGGGG